MGHVSPQHHVKHDDFFETITDKSSNFDSTEPSWKTLSGLVKNDHKKSSSSEGATSPIPMNNTTRIDDLNDINLPPELDQDQRETSSDNLSETSPNQASHQQETVPHGSEGGTATDTIPNPSVMARSGRNIRRTQRMEESTQQREQGIVAWEVLYDQDEVETKLTQSDQFILQGRLSNPIAFATSVDPNIMYYHQAMKEPDHEQFQRSVLKEIQDHEMNQHWEVIPKQDMRPNTKLLDMVWAMWRKRRIDTRQVYKRKARLNIHGGQQEHGVNFWETYMPVVSWQTLRLFSIHSILKGWHSKQMDFVLAYPHAPAEVPLYMHFPKGYEFKDGISEDTHVLKLTKNIYGQKQAGRVWNKYLDEGLVEIGFKPSKMDPCLYFRGRIALLVYIDDHIMFGPNLSELNKVVTEMRMSSKKFRVEDLGNVKDFMGIQVTTKNDKTITLNKPQLIDSILKDMKFQNNMKEKDTPALSLVILQKDTQGKPFNNDFHYRRVISKLNVLEKSTRPDISYVVHQCARFCEPPKQ